MTQAQRTYTIRISNVSVQPHPQPRGSTKGGTTPPLLKGKHRGRLRLRPDRAHLPRAGPASSPGRRLVAVAMAARHFTWQRDSPRNPTGVCRWASSSTGFTCVVPTARPWPTCSQRRFRRRCARSRRRCWRPPSNSSPRNGGCPARNGSLMPVTGSYNPVRSPPRGFPRIGCNAAQNPSKTGCCSPTPTRCGARCGLPFLSPVAVKRTR